MIIDFSSTRQWAAKTKSQVAKATTGLTLPTLLVTALLSGCATSIDEQGYLRHQQQQLQTFIADTEIGSHLVSQNNAAKTMTVQDETNWWQQFNSTQLNLLVADALVKNHDLKTSQLQLQSALAYLGSQQAEYLPQGGVEIGSSRNSLDNSITQQSSANLAMYWQLDLFGRLSALVDAAQASALAQTEQRRLLHIEVISSVVKGFVSYQGNLQKQLIVTKQVQALQQSIDVLQAQVDEGEANELDLNRTKAQLSQQQMLVPEIKYLLHRDLTTLAMLTGRLVSDIVLENEQNIIKVQFDVNLLKPSEAIAMRPDISQALYEFSQANALSEAARKALLPDISLNAFSGVLTLGSNPLSNSQQQWQVSPQIEWSLLSYPALLAQRDAQQYLSEAAYSEYQQVVLKAINESELSLQLLLKESDKNRFANNRYLYANKAFLQAKAMYQEGQIPYLQLLDARQDVLIAEESSVDSSISSLLAKVDAYHAFNGRWSYAVTSL